MYDWAKARFLSIWRGEQSLAITFWVWYVLVAGALIWIGGALLAVFIAETFHTQEPYIWWLAAIVIGTIWSNVALWRSASRTGGGWSVLTRALQGLSLVGIIVAVTVSYLQPKWLTDRNTTEAVVTEPEKVEQPKTDPGSDGGLNQEQQR